MVVARDGSLTALRFVEGPARFSVGNVEGPASLEGLDEGRELDVVERKVL